jgi:hypothetical protein
MVKTEPEVKAQSLANVNKGTFIRLDVPALCPSFWCCGSRETRLVSAFRRRPPLLSVTGDLAHSLGLDLSVPHALSGREMLWLRAHSADSVILQYQNAEDNSILLEDGWHVMPTGGRCSLPAMLLTKNEKKNPYTLCASAARAMDEAGLLFRRPAGGSAAGGVPARGLWDARSGKAPRQKPQQNPHQLPHALRQLPPLHPRQVWPLMFLAQTTTPHHTTPHHTTPHHTTPHHTILSLSHVAASLQPH